MTISELKELSRANGNCWFDKETMRFWNSHICSGIICGKYFITSEDNYNGTKTLYSIRTFNEKGEIDTVGEFQGYATIQDARDALRKFARVTI